MSGTEVVKKRPCRPIRWVRLFAPITKHSYMQYVGCDARVETPVDAEGIIYVSINGKGDWKERIPWKNTDTSSNYPKRIVDLLEQNVKKHGFAQTCDLSALELRIDRLFEYIDRTQSNFSQCVVCGCRLSGHKDIHEPLPSLMVSHPKIDFGFDMASYCF